MEMEPVVQPETEVRELGEVKRLRLSRRMQAVTIELCMAHLATWDVKPMLIEHMKNTVSRICGLTDKDFEREDIEKDGTEKTTDAKGDQNSEYDRTDPKYRGGAD